MTIKKFENFNQFNLIIERLHVNKEIDEYSDKIYTLISNSNEHQFEFTDLPINLNISKLIINIKDMNVGLSGQLDFK
jgi:hypothetical protein